ncbi:hypothetical protein QYE76_066633 [Lolium multiflorum]|uniref:CCHC-type domain-containing protein n=1 Tax=Lolium multiflorum TaxID=4521 RepID=A0AAD8WA37_LOLMU|nr:hypothetical protein QYE76_066633 [Lolium multiflorum]
MEDHVELDTDNGSACIGDMTDIEHLYTDHDSPSMDNMVDHHSELDHNINDMVEHYLDYDYDTMMEHRTEHYLDYDYDTMMEHRTEHYLDYDIDTMVEPNFNTTLHKTDGATMRVLTHMIIYIELVLWNNKSVPAMIAIDTLLRAQEGATSKVPSYMNHHLGMLRIVIDTRHLKIVVDHHHLMIAIDMRHHMIIADTSHLMFAIDMRHHMIIADTSHLMFAIDMRHHMIIADTSHLMFAIDQHLPRIFDDTPQDMPSATTKMASPRPPTHEKISNGARQDATSTRKMVASAHKEEPPIMVPPPPTATTTMAPTRSSSPKMKTMESTLQDEGRSTQLYANMTMICPPRPRSSQCFRCTQDGHHLWECPNLHCDVCTSNKHMTWECNTPQAHKLYFAQLDAQFANKTLQDTIIFKEWCKEMDKMMTMKPTLQDGAREGQDKSDVDSSLALNNTIAPSNGVNMAGDGVEKVEHGMIPSTKVANGVENGEHGMIPSPMEVHGVENGEHGILPSPTEAHGVEMVEHGKFPSTTEACGDDKIEPTPICLNDEMVPIPCEHESHLAHLSESDSELSDSHPICEYECFHLEDMSDTQSELREVDDRSTEDIAFANTLTSPSFVSSYVAIGSMEDEFPIMEKMYMVHEDDDITPCLQEVKDVDHMDPTTSTTPTSNESDYKGTYMGVDDAMIPLVDMMTYECMHDLEDTIAMPHALFIPPCDALLDNIVDNVGMLACDNMIMPCYECFNINPIACNLLNNLSFPCDALLDNIVDHVELLACDNMVMPCYESFTFSPIACNMSNNCSLPCIACNENDDANACVVTPLMNTCSFHRVVDNNDNMLNMLCPKCLHYSMFLASKIVNNDSFLCLVCKNAYFIVHEMAPIAFSIFDDPKLPHAMNAPSCHMHHHHAFHTILLDTNGDVHKTWNIMMDDVFIYHAHTLFAFSIVCIGIDDKYGGKRGCHGDPRTQGRCHGSMEEKEKEELDAPGRNFRP